MPVSDAGTRNAAERDDAASADAGSVDVASSRWDVFCALDDAKNNLVGSCCHSDKADGTTTAPALPATPGLSIGGIGKIPLPVVGSHAAGAIKENAWEVQDKSYHGTFQIEPRRLRLCNPAWETSLNQIAQTAACKLGLDPDVMTAKLDMLLYMDKGGRVDRCRNVNKGRNVVGTLLVQLPSIFTGGKMRVFGGKGQAVRAIGRPGPRPDRDAEEASSFDLGSAGEAEFSCHFACYYADVEYAFEAIESGSRTLLRYSLHYPGSRGRRKPAASLLHNESASWLERSLAKLPRVERIMLIPTATKYDAISLASRGINALSKYRRAEAEAIKVAGKNWKLLLVNASMRITYGGRGAHFFFNEPAASIEHIFDERGNEVSSSMGWLKDVVNFDDVMNNEQAGMLLPWTYMDDDYSDTWGACDTIASRGDGDSDSEEEPEDATTEIYSSTFLLIHDTSVADVELRCLGGCSGVAEVAMRVVTMRDYGLLERLLSAVELKEESKFTVSTCIALLRMAMRSAGRKPLEIASDWANKILFGLSTWAEPNDKLFATILSAVEKFGHDKLSAGVSKLLGDKNRMRGSELLIFLRRSDFLLNLEKHVSGKSGYLENCLSDLASHGSTHIANSDEVSRMIENMIRQHGWGPMECVVKAALDFMHKVGSLLFSNLMARFLLLRKFEKARRRRSVTKQAKGVYGFIHACIVDFTKTFVRALLANSNQVSLQYMSGSRKGIFMMAICWVIEHGRKEELNSFGRFTTESEEVFSTLMEVIAKSTCGMSPRVMSREILNKCLVQNPVKGYLVTSSWSNSIPPSIHIRKILEAYPDMAKETDENGRLPLHHAADISGDTFDAAMDIFHANPKSASVRDPLSGLYPFMLAASNGQIAVSFNLLLADPSLVVGSTNGDIMPGASKKRKRSQLFG